MHIEIFKLAHVGYLIIGIALALFSVIIKSNSDKDEKAKKILWITGSIISGCAGGVLTVFIMQGVLAIIIAFIMITLGTAFITLIIGNTIRKMKEKR